ncbi:hypothetical protein CCACVL1_14016 [Corchorus capsularis]|uniref:Uncharacterized protein n=1 Tax=Corchorus capsularis TaxID=210143 RepID=A0A1R3I8N4_COCAP|nr:hypothetical protein CCACVL1_14016 [Corchorus capsularis]
MAPDSHTAKTGKGNPFKGFC